MLKTDSVVVQRYFEYKNDTLFMYSRVPGEYSSFDLVSQMSFYLPAKGETNSLAIIQNAPDDCPIEYRVGELGYFLNIAILFNPKNRTDYGLPQTSSEDLP